jgi:hypothetical protein
MIKLKNIVNYIIIHLTYYKIRVYYFIIRICSELRKHPIRIHIWITPAPHSYSTTSALHSYSTTSVFIFKIWKRIWEGHYAIRIRSVSTSTCTRLMNLCRGYPSDHPLASLHNGHHMGESMTSKTFFSTRARNEASCIVRDHIFALNRNR